MTPQPGDLVEIASLIDALMVDCWPYGLVYDVASDGRVLVVMIGDHVRRGGSGAGCRVWLPEDLRVVYRPAPSRGTP